MLRRPTTDRFAAKYLFLAYAFSSSQFLVEGSPSLVLLDLDLWLFLGGPSGYFMVHTELFGAYSVVLIYIHRAAVCVTLSGHANNKFTA